MAAKRVLVVGLGNMGMSHARAYTRIPGCEVAGLCERRIEREQRFLPRAVDEDLDLADHMEDVVKSLRTMLVADKSARTGEVVRL